MSASLTISGIAELRAELSRLPSELKGEATAIVLDTAYAAKDDIVSQYPQGETGNLKKGVKVFVKEIGPFSVAAQVKSTAPHAWWHEHGSEVHHRVTKKGWNRGTMFSKKGPPRPVFIPTMIRHRRAMYAKLAALLERHGITVTRVA